MNTRKLIVGGMVLVVAFVVLSSRSFADDTAQLKQQIEQLQKQVSQLQSQITAQDQKNQPDEGFAANDFDPFREMERMQRRMNRMMQGSTMPVMDMFKTNVDMKQTDQHYIVMMDLPGMQKDNINVEVKKGILIVSGERNSEIEETKGNQFFRKERSFGHFSQSIPLLDDAKADLIDAQYENGVLKVTIPREKKDSKKADSRKVIIK